MIAILAGGLLIGPARLALAASLPFGFVESQLDIRVAAAEFPRPTGMQFAPDGRLYLFQQDGEIYIFDPGTDTLLQTPMIDIPTNSSNEHGLLGLTFDPDFSSNGYFYVYYTTVAPNSVNRVSRFTATGDTASPASEVVLIETDPIGSAVFHHGGALRIGPDGMLYIAIGDVARPADSQSFTSLFGKILRINTDGSIPTDNPFFATTTGKYRAIWSMGLRHPYNFSFQPGSGVMLISEVGQNTWEEINEGQAGRNFGWPTTEGMFDPLTYPTFTLPTVVYRHGGGNDRGCSITAGAFNRGGMFPASYHNQYFYGDYCNQWIRSYDTATGISTLFATAVERGLISVEFGPDGSLYYLIRTRFSLGSPTNEKGILYRVVYYDSATPPTITLDPSDDTVAVGQSATFQCSATGNPAPTYQWQRDGANILGATGDTLTLPSTSLTDDGARFRCVATNPFGSDTSTEATLTVLNNTPPVAAITTPADGSPYLAGDIITFAGTGTDAEDGTLGPAAFEWMVLFHHGTHTHPFVPPTAGIDNGTFTIPIDSHGDTNVFYRIYLTVTDSTGLTDSVTVDILPVITTLTFATDPPGLQVTVDGMPIVGPGTMDVVAGSRLAIVAASQRALGQRWIFDSWSDGGPATHNIFAPAGGAIYTATFRPQPGGDDDDDDGGGPAGPAIQSPEGLIVDVEPNKQLVNPVDVVNWTVTVTNPGAATVGDVVLSGTYAEAFTIRAISTSQGEAVFDPLRFVAQIGDMGPGAVVIIRIETDFEAGQSFQLPAGAAGLMAPGEFCLTGSVSGASDTGCVRLLPGILPETGNRPSESFPWLWLLAGLGAVGLAGWGIRLAGLRRHM